MKKRITSLVVILVFIFTMVVTSSPSMVLAEDNPSDNGTQIEQTAETITSDTVAQTDTDPEEDFTVPEDHLTDLDKPMTKLELCDILIDLYNFEKEQLGGAPEPVVPTVSPFKDTDDLAVLKAFSLGIISVPKNRMFYPNRPVTKLVKMQMFYNFLKIFDPNIENDVPHDPDFEDTGEIASWAEKAINYLHEKGIADPDQNGEFNPNDTITTEDSNEMTMQLSEVIDNHKPYYLYGFDIINNRYVNHGGFTAESILDEEKVNDAIAAKKVAINKYDDSQHETKVKISEKMSDAYKSLDVKVDGKYNGVAWSGEASAEYGTNEEVKQNSKMISSMEFHGVKDVAIQFKTTPYKDLLSDGFLQAIAPLGETASDTTLSPEDYETAKDVFDHYGSHLVTHYVMGGRLDLNANFDDRSDIKMTTAEVEAAAKNLYGSVSTDVTIKNNVKTMKSNSTIHFLGEGGKNIGGTSFDDLVSQYPSWRDSLNFDNSDICRLFDDSLTPAWKLLDQKDQVNGPTNQIIAKKLEMAFDKIAEDQGILLEGYVPARDGDIITDITVRSANNAGDIKCPYGYRVVREYGWKPANDDEMANPMAGAVDFNKGAGGAYIYVFYKMGTLKDVIDNPQENRNITDVYITTDENSTPGGYYRIPNDLNQGAGGDYIYLNLGKKWDDRHYTKMSAIVNDSNQIDNPMGWERPTHDMDLNKGSGGKYIYLIFQREVIPDNDPKNPVIKVDDLDPGYRAGDDYQDATTAYDAKDGDITSKMTITGVPQSPLKWGSYTVTYTVRDSDGNVAQRSKHITVFPKWKTPW